LIGRIEEKETLERRGHSRKLISRGCILDLSGSGWGPLAGCFKHSDECSSCIKCGEFIDWLSNY
jgi:hypothetical protein